MQEEGIPVLTEASNCLENNPNEGEQAPKFTCGPYPLDMAMLKEHREKLVARYQNTTQEPELSLSAERILLLFQGGESQLRDETDHEPVFRQQSTFQYLFGVREPDCFATIDASNGVTTLYVPRLPEAYAIWMGEIHPPSHFKEVYCVDRCLYIDEMPADIEEFNPEVIHTTRGLNTDSGNYAKEATFDGISKYKVDNTRLYDDIVECRVIKSESELKLLQFVNDVSSEAHIQVMAAAKDLTYEYQLESRFLSHCYEFGGCRHPGYTAVCACGPNSAVLHYGHAAAPNDRKLLEEDICLLDMGGEAHCWGADITCSFPKSGVFSQRQKDIFNAVQAMQFAVMDALKPGVSWIDMHTLSYQVLCEKLTTLGLLRGSLDDMMASNIGAVFMPHGLGHFMGLDTHDVGGYPKGAERDTRDGYKSLRCVRIMQPGMVITVEPGIYFIDVCIDKALADPEQSKYLVEEVLNEYRGFGGVRLEDNVVITENGIHNMTNCPRTVEDVEAVMAGNIQSRHDLFKKC